MPDARIARRHRIGIGTIVREASITVALKHGARLGRVEESFVARLVPGDCFVFAGRVVEFVALRELTAWVEPARKKAARMPFSFPLLLEIFRDTLTSEALEARVARMVSELEAAVSR